MKKKPSRHSTKRNAAAGHGKQSTSPRGGPGSDRRNFYILAAAIAAIAGFVTIAIIAHFLTDMQHSGGDDAGFSRLVKISPPQAMEDIAFVDGDGKPRNLAEWKGRVVLLNLWATWCPPCREEMPGLARLQAKLGGGDFAVVAVSQDRIGVEAPRKFLASAKLTQLGLFVDPSGSMIKTLKTPGLPLTVLIDREGRQIARLVGPAAWDSPEAEAIVRAAITAPR